jgi:proteic killer suppression protein
MIKSFNDKETESFYLTGKSSHFPSTIIKVTLRKLDFLNAAHNINDLRVPPGNRLEKLKGDLEGKFSIRINDQYRIIFRFEQSDAFEVEITDYHK